ncbi:MAG: cation:proton antiporter [Candidatus Rokubacteria bacterium]|nr:cation:proton antiporter [Candidatus Rokubacteria bacterium]
MRTKEDTATLSELLEPMSELFVPLFFVLMGIQVHLASLADPAALGFGAVLLVCAVIGKLATALGVLERDTNRIAVAIGMVPRGEVGLIFAGIGAALLVNGEPVLSQATYSAVVLMVLVTTLVTPPGLRWTLGRRALTAQRCAIASTSSSAPNGSFDTSTVERAGGRSPTWRR